MLLDLLFFIFQLFFWHLAKDNVVFCRLFGASVVVPAAATLWPNKVYVCAHLQVTCYPAGVYNWNYCWICYNSNIQRGTVLPNSFLWGSLHLYCIEDHAVDFLNVWSFFYSKEIVCFTLPRCKETGHFNAVCVFGGVLWLHVGTASRTIQHWLKIVLRYAPLACRCSGE